MYPNSKFRLRYPTIFEEASEEKLPQQTKKIGFYRPVFSLVEKTGLYDALIQSYGIENANMILDFSVFRFNPLVSELPASSNTYTISFPDAPARRTGPTPSNFVFPRINPRTAALCISVPKAKNPRAAALYPGFDSWRLAQLHRCLPSL